MRPIRLLSAAVIPLAALWLAACGDSEATKAIPTRRRARSPSRRRSSRSAPCLRPSK